MAHSQASKEKMRIAALRRTPPTIDRFLARIEPDLNSGCWLWSGAWSREKYGFIKDRGVAVNAHRFSYTAHHGSIPPGMMVCHKCDTPACVNPDHLFLGTARDNALDMQRKGRKATYAGANNHFAKIDEPTALEIARRLKAGERPADIARLLSVSPITVSQINCGKSWRQATGFERKPPIRGRPDRAKRPLQSRPFSPTRKEVR